jgi:hypothetical protein
MTEAFDGGREKDEITFEITSVERKANSITPGLGV